MCVLIICHITPLQWDIGIIFIFLQFLWVEIFWDLLFTLFFVLKYFKYLEDFAKKGIDICCKSVYLSKKKYLIRLICPVMKQRKCVFIRLWFHNFAIVKALHLNLFAFWRKVEMFMITVWNCCFHQAISLWLYYLIWNYFMHSIF